MNRSSSNLNIEAAHHYHEATKHSETKLHSDTHFLDWSNQPRPFKIYCDVESVPLPSDTTILVAGSPPLLDVIGTSPVDVGDQGSAELIPDLDVLARTLYLTAGVGRPVW